MKLRIVATIALACLLITCYAEKYSITSTTLNVRDQPSTQGKVIGTLNKGFEINVDEINNGFARFDFLGTKGYVSTKYLVKSQTETVAPIESTPNNEAENTTADTNDGKNLDDNFVKSTTDKVSKGFSKLKSKLLGDKEKDKTEQPADTADNNFAKLKFKKTKFNSIITDSVYGFTTEYEDFKTDNGTQYFGFRVEEHRDNKTYFYLFKDYTRGAIEKGRKILIRTKNGYVGEIEAVNSGSSELYSSWRYEGDDTYQTVDYSEFRIFYRIPLELMSAIQDHGIIRMREFHGDDVSDYEFSGKKFDKANEKMFNMICTICRLYNNRNNLPWYPDWKKIKVRKKKSLNFNHTHLKSSEPSITFDCKFRGFFIPPCSFLDHGCV